MGSQIKLFLALATAWTIIAAVAAFRSLWSLFYLSLAFLLASPYIASLVIYITKLRTNRRS